MSVGPVLPTDPGQLPELKRPPLASDAQSWTPKLEEISSQSASEGDAGQGKARGERTGAKHERKTRTRTRLGGRS